MYFVVVTMLTVQVRIFQSTYVEILLLIYYSSLLVQILVVHLSYSND